MGSNVIFFGWDRAVPGREQLAGQHFQEFVQYLGGQQAQGAIQSFEVVFLNAHGGDLGGFFLIRGESPKLDALMASSEWEAHQTRALLQMEGSGAIRGVTGDLIMERMALWMASIPA
jgi:hypothetical protein